MAKTIQAYFPASVKWLKAEGGLYIWARSPVKNQTSQNSKVFTRALQEDVLYVPGDLCYAPDPTRKAPKTEMRLSFGSASERDIGEGIRRLGKVLQEVVAPG